VNQPHLPRALAFWLVAIANGLLLFASSAPSPLYVVYQADWGFSTATLTFIFAVYVLFLLAALVFTGALSDHIGRRPTLLLALVVQLASMVMFAEASGGRLAGGRPDRAGDRHRCRDGCGERDPDRSAAAR
jgi:MFS family permease